MFFSFEQSWDALLIMQSLALLIPSEDKAQFYIFMEYMAGPPGCRANNSHGRPHAMHGGQRRDAIYMGQTQGQEHEAHMGQTQG